MRKHNKQEKTFLKGTPYHGKQPGTTGKPDAAALAHSSPKRIPWKKWGKEAQQVIKEQ
ncbi:hypothetical protein [Akkermansia muciniphila]|jgi:hypothetical protein|uniref:hypothetical protein n=1 Tax=Akkermansia muciniphila TaxID=239935 RepID=UPI001C0642F5|nr:hypothetical protein [Akkermansia muciniphila]QWP06125.1 hypothetical protein J5W77_03465 [Akkermansia muciniphila]QWP23698.1 hypothetical protein J5W81_09435 [Akkermansia muciniphila]